MQPRAVGRIGGGLRAWAPHVLTVLLIWLGWQMVVGLLVQRSPVETAIRVAPSSGQALSRAAEAEMVAGRVDAARDLAGMALRAAPFDVRALRVLGLAVARTDPDAADELLTLAGNWSLRDDPSHAWLIRRRLEQGDYAGAFGHADALARRREDVHPRIFQLFTVAVAEDPRAAPHLIARLAPWPNWRPAYLESLRTGPQAAQVQATLALGLQRTDGPLNDGELQTVYGEWLRQGRLPGLRELRRRLRRPPPATLHDGGFEGRAGPTPFNWILEAGPGVQAEISAGPESQGKALFLETDGFSTRTVASQVLLLDPGPYRLAGRFRFEAGGRDPRFSWSIRCLETNAVIAAWSPTAAQDQSDWADGRTEFTVPSANCTTQWLELKTRRGTRRSAVVAWFDTLALVPLSAKTTGN